MGYPKDILSFHINMSQNSHARIKLIWNTVIDDECAHEWLKGKKRLNDYGKFQHCKSSKPTKKHFCIYVFLHIYVICI